MMNYFQVKFCFSDIMLQYIALQPYTVLVPVQICALQLDCDNKQQNNVKTDLMVNLYNKSKVALSKNLTLLSTVSLPFSFKQQF